MSFPTGEQYELSFTSAAGVLRATITELAAGLRELSLDGVHLVQGFDPEIQPPGAAGITLVPWANRVRDGVWVDVASTAHQLAITEVDRNNAIHGLLRFTAYRVLDRSESSITLAAQVFPQMGYPFHLEYEIRYELGESGLTVTNTVRNITSEPASSAAGPAPVTLGAHPYLQISDVPTAELVLTVSADTHIDVDERLNPIGLSPVENTRFDVRATSPLSRRVGDLKLDDAWADVHFYEGITSHTLEAPDGRSVGLWGDSNYGFVQVYTNFIFPVRGSDAVTTAIAIEPMTGPADAYNSGIGLKRLEVGEEWVAQWGINFAGFVSA